MSVGRVAAPVLAAALAACSAQPDEPQFPKAERDVAPVVGDSFSTEAARDRVGEARQVMALAGIAPGMSVADVGAGEGYYTIRLASAVGASGRVLAEDIDPAIVDALAQRVLRERLDNVSVKLGSPTDPMLPDGSFDRVLLVHMYHEVTEPYAFLWHLREGVKPGGRVIVVDADRPVRDHGISKDRLDCEFRALGFAPVTAAELAGDSYFRAFQMVKPRPEPAAIQACPASMDRAR